MIGAGLAGLTAAFELTEAGHHVTVLEARTRAGGRVCTLRGPFSDGLYSEAGALSLPQTHARAMHYVRLFRLPADPVRPAPNTIFHVRGRRIVAARGARVDWPLDLREDERRLGLDGMYQKYVGAALAEVGDPAAAGWPPAALWKYDRVSFAEFLRARGASRGAVALLRLGYLDLLGDGVDTVSALEVLREQALEGGSERYLTIRGGNDALPGAFASRLAGRVCYGAAVVAIGQDACGARVTCLVGGGQRTLAADRVVCAIPFSVLRHVKVTPGFSAAKQRAIRELGYTSVTRVYLQSRRRFWAEGDELLTANTDLPVMWCLDGAAGQPGPRGILQSYMAGPQARRAAALTEGERLALTLDGMEKVFPGIRENCEGGVSYCWDQDPWARGAYAWFRPGQMSALFPHLGAPEGRVHFAGEHTSAWTGWMEGALESGQRAAREVNEAC